MSDNAPNLPPQKTTKYFFTRWKKYPKQTCYSITQCLANKVTYSLSKILTQEVVGRSEQNQRMETTVRRNRSGSGPLLTVFCPATNAHLHSPPFALLAALLRGLTSLLREAVWSKTAAISHPQKFPSDPTHNESGTSFLEKKRLF